MLDDLTIGEVARRAGVRSSALRYYESIGLLPVARRVNGRRRYAPDTIRMLAVIRLAQQAGFTIAEMQTLFHGFEETTRPGDRWLPLAEHKLEELDTLINRARQMQHILQRLLTCNCEHLEECGVDQEDVEWEPDSGAARELPPHSCARP